MYVFSKQNNSYSFCAMLNMGALHSRIFIINTESGPTRKLCGVDYCKKEFFPEPKKIIPVPHSGPCGSVQQLRALASQQCHLGSIPRLGVLSGLSLLLVLVLALRGLFPVTCDSNPVHLISGKRVFFPFSLSKKIYIYIKPAPDRRLYFRVLWFSRFPLSSKTNISKLHFNLESVPNNY